MDLPTSTRTLFVLLTLTLLLTACMASSKEECYPMSIRLRSFRLKSNCNQSVLEDKQMEAVQASTTVLLVPCIYLLAFVIGLPANLIALWVLVFHTKKLPSTSLLINLTAMDLMLLVLLPFRIAYHFHSNDWVFGEPLCRLVTALFYGNMYGSMLCLMLVSIDRYVALVHPFGARTMRSQRVSVCMSGVVWLVVLASMLPLLLSQQSYKLDIPPITMCHDALPEAEQEHFFSPYFTCLFVVCFLLPLLVILFSYGNVLRTLMAGRKRYAHAVHITVLVLLVFLICFLPSNILLLLHYSDIYEIDDAEDLYAPYMISLALSTFNSCIDPFIFYYVSDDFRARVRKALSCHNNADRGSSSGNQVLYSSSEQSGKSKVTLLSHSKTVNDQSSVL